jgi:TonB family protein
MEAKGDLHFVTYEAPGFPPELAGLPVRFGGATLLFTFDRSGRIVDSLVMEASHPAFAAAVYRSVQKWQMAPVKMAMSTHRESVRFAFDQRASFVALTHREGGKESIDPYIDQSASAVHTCKEAELKSPLVPIEHPTPSLPDSFNGTSESGQATVNFVVDVEGRVRVPGVTGASSMACAEAAAAAIKRWRFAPPTQNGVPVQVAVDRTFRFGNGQPKSGGD